VVTTLGREKTPRAVTARTPGGVPFGGYEIRLGDTRPQADADLAPFATLEDGSGDGARAPGVIGTYLHGALEHPAVCAELFGIDASGAASKSAEYEKLADWFEVNGCTEWVHGLGNVSNRIDVHAPPSGPVSGR
jgi:cobyric acid synthase